VSGLSAPFSYFWADVVYTVVCADARAGKASAAVATAARPRERFIG
jgi:hypothetical protein